MKCPECKKDFYEGEKITLTEDNEQLVHSECREYKLNEKKRYSILTKM